MPILVSGSLAFDRIMDFPGKFSNHILPHKIHDLNVSFLINGIKENFGGTAGNIAYNLSLLGERPYILSCSGKDFGDYGAWLKKNKIYVSEISRVEEKLTAGAYIITDSSDNQITGFNPGAMGHPRGMIDKKLLKNSFAIVSPGNIDDMGQYPILYKKNKVKYIFDPGQATTALSAQVLAESIKGAEMLIGNDYEIELIRERLKWTNGDITKNAKILVITKGKDGSEIITRKKKIFIQPVKSIKAFDPTGAGDAYRAGVIKGLINGWAPEKWGRLASVVASFAVEKYGTQNHRFDMKDIQERYKINYSQIKLN